MGGPALCRRPLPGAARYRADIDDLAQYIGCNAGRLAELPAATAQAANIVRLVRRRASDD